MGTGYLMAAYGRLLLSKLIQTGELLTGGFGYQISLGCGGSAAVATKGWVLSKVDRWQFSLPRGGWMGGIGQDGNCRLKFGSPGSTC